MTQSVIRVLRRFQLASSPCVEERECRASVLNVVLLCLAQFSSRSGISDNSPSGSYCLSPAELLNKTTASPNASLHAVNPSPASTWSSVLNGSVNVLSLSNTQPEQNHNLFLNCISSPCIPAALSCFQLTDLNFFTVNCGSAKLRSPCNDRFQFLDAVPELSPSATPSIVGHLQS